MNKLILELNEFNLDLLVEAAKTRPPISRFLEKGRGSFYIPDTYHSDFLEPWSQWVTTHTGQPTSVHGIKHLGDVKDLKVNQIWDIYPEKFGLIWGCLNSMTPKNSDIIYFPDPWTKSSRPTRWYLQPILEFLQYSVSKRSTSSFIEGVIGAVKIMPSAIYTFVFLMPYLDVNFVTKTIGLGKGMFSTSIVYSAVESLIFKYAVKTGSKRAKTDIIFINMLAHGQHYYWNTEKHYIIDYIFDRISDMISYAENKYKTIIIYNGLSQEYSGDIESWHSWVPKGGWNYYIKNIISLDCEVSPCMSYDVNLYFQSPKILEAAINKLESIALNDDNKPIFLIEKSKTDSCNLFVRVDYFGPGNIEYSINNISYKINETFDLTAIRTGRHAQHSCVIGEGVDRYSSDKDQNEKSVNFYV